MGSYVVLVLRFFVFPADRWLCIFSAYLTSGWLSLCRVIISVAAVLLFPYFLAAGWCWMLLFHNLNVCSFQEQEMIRIRVIKIIIVQYSYQLK